MTFYLKIKVKVAKCWNGEMNNVELQWERNPQFEI
jgi:hypothetical protein